jgi:hypothetical protein
MKDTPPAVTRSTLTLRGVVPKAVQPSSTQLNDERYFYVWAPSRRNPRQRHPTRELAEAEALRLATLQPGVLFCVYQATRLARVLK